MFEMTKPPDAETVSTRVVTALRSPGMIDQIVFARSELSSRERPNVLGDCLPTGPDADTLQPERFNFVPGANGLCYAMPMSLGEAAPHPEKRDGWLVLFVAPENSVSTAVWRPVGWYEEARLAGSYQRRPEPELRQYLYVVSTQAKNAYVIPGDKRASFPVIASDHFTKRWTYARSPSHSGKWRERLAELAEQIVSRKSECIRIG